jgi:superfamily II DNA/RNA helicase
MFRSQLKEIPHIVIGTPNKILELVNTKVIPIIILKIYELTE